jgi:hypothetical protein
MPGTLTIRLEYTDQELTIANCPCDTDIQVVVNLLVEYDEFVYTSTITVDGVTKPFPDVDSVRQYMSGNLTFAKLLQKHLGFIPYYNENNVYISEVEFNALYKHPEFTDVLGVQVPKAFADKMHKMDLEYLKDDVEDILTVQDSNEIIHEALCKLSSTGGYTINDMAVYYTLGMLDTVIGKDLFINGDKLYEDNMRNRMINGITFPAIYKFAIPKVDSHLPIELARYLPEYKKNSDMFTKLRKKSYAYEMALEAYMEDNMPI